MPMWVVFPENLEPPPLARLSNSGRLWHNPGKAVHLEIVPTLLQLS